MLFNNKDVADLIMERYRFKNADAGGLCSWYIRENGDYTFTIITDEDGLTAPKDSDAPVIIGRYNDDMMGCVENTEVSSFWKVIEVLEYFDDIEGLDFDDHMLKIRNILKP